MYALLKTQQTAPERKRNASEADKQQANKEQTIVNRTAAGSTCPAATRLLGKPGLLHTPHCEEVCQISRHRNRREGNWEEVCQISRHWLSPFKCYKEKNCETEHIEIGQFNVQLCSENQCNWAALMALIFIPTSQLNYFTKFSPEDPSKIELWEETKKLYSSEVQFLALWWCQ